MKSLMKKFKEKVNQLKIQITILNYAITDSRTPWYAKAIGVLVVGYALSPIDFIPDFIPILGLLDDMILLPLGIVITIKLIPTQVIEDARLKAIEKPSEDKSHRVSAAIIILLWLLIIGAILTKLIL